MSVSKKPLQLYIGSKYELGSIGVLQMVKKPINYVAITFTR